jgi:hypothetical protein
MNSRQNSFSGLPAKKSMMATQQQQKQPKSIIEIYTDWANHYLVQILRAEKFFWHFQILEFWSIFWHFRFFPPKKN